MRYTFDLVYIYIQTKRTKKKRILLFLCAVDDTVLLLCVCFILIFFSAFLFLISFTILTCYNFYVFVLQTTTKEGYLLKQTWTFQRWRRRYFRLKGHRLYYAKDAKVSFDLLLNWVLSHLGMFHHLTMVMLWLEILERDCSLFIELFFMIPLVSGYESRQNRVRTLQFTEILFQLLLNK